MFIYESVCLEFERVQIGSKPSDNGYCAHWNLCDKVDQLGNHLD